MFFTQGNFGTYPTVFTSYYVTIFYLIFNSFSHSINKLLFVLEDSKKTILSDVRRQKTHKYSQRIYYVPRTILRILYALSLNFVRKNYCDHLRTKKVSLRYVNSKTSNAEVQDECSFTGS